MIPAKPNQKNKNMFGNVNSKCSKCQCKRFENRNFNSKGLIFQFTRFGASIQFFWDFSSKCLKFQFEWIEIRYFMSKGFIFQFKRFERSFRSWPGIAHDWAWYGRTAQNRGRGRTDAVASAGVGARGRDSDRDIGRGRGNRAGQDRGRGSDRDRGRVRGRGSGRDRGIWEGTKSLNPFSIAGDHHWFQIFGYLKICSSSCSIQLSSSWHTHQIFWQVRTPTTATLVGQKTKFPDVVSKPILGSGPVN